MYLRKPSGRQLVVLGLCFLGLFILTAVWVTLDATPTLDTAIITGLRHADDVTNPLGPLWLEEGMRDITAMGSNWVLLYLSGLGAGLLYLRGYTRLAGYTVLSILLALAVTFALKYGFTRPRPDLVEHGTKTFTSSFPSAHAMMSAICYFTLAATSMPVSGLARVRWLFFIAAGVTTVLVGFSRVYLGVHWPTDILAGWFAGAMWVLLWYVLVIHQRREPEQPQ